MQWSVGVKAQGAQVRTHEEIIELADAVAVHNGIATGLGSDVYGAQILVEADSREDALEKGTELFRASARTAGLPDDDPIVHSEATSEDDEAEENTL
jgi:hypothetical protein